MAPARKLLSIEDAGQLDEREWVAPGAGDELVADRRVHVPGRVCPRSDAAARASASSLDFPDPATPGTTRARPVEVRAASIKARSPHVPRLDQPARNPPYRDATDRTGDPTEGAGGSLSNPCVSANAGHD